MYNYSFAKLGLDYAYVAFDVKEDQVKEALDAVKLFHMRGINVTMPDKTEAAKYVDELSPAAQIIGAVNTIVNDDGKLTGYITDGEGFVHNLKDHGVDIKGKKITVAGGGGAARSRFSILRMHFLSVLFRPQKRSEKQCQELLSMYMTLRIRQR